MTARLNMNEIIEDFAKAHALRNGYLLAQTISPVAPNNEPHRLRRIWQSTNTYSLREEIKRCIKSHNSLKASLSADEINGWVEVYSAYWNALGEILAGENGKVNNFGFPTWI